MEDEDELLDLVDENDSVIKVVKRTDYYQLGKKPFGYLRSTELFIRNSNGQLWIPRRSSNKSIAPNALDYSCGGHVTSNEDYTTSLIREAKEELDLNLTPSDLVFLQKFSPSKAAPWFRCLYLYEYNDVPQYNKQDFQEYFWLYPDELFNMLIAGEPAKSSMLETLTQLKDRL